MKKTAKILKSDLTNYNVFFLTGDNQHSVRETVDEIIAANIGDESLKDFNFNHFTEENHSAEEISNSLHSLPMMTDKRIVYISEIEKMSADIHSMLLLFLKKNYDTTVLIITGIKPDKRKVFFKEIAKLKSGISAEFKAKNEREILAWINEYVQKKGRSITPIAINLFSTTVSSDLNNIASELDKLILFTEKEHTIDEDDIEKVLGISKDFNIFKLINTVSNKQLNKSIEICDRIMKMKENRSDPIAINIMLSRMFVSAFEISSNSYIKGISMSYSAKDMGYDNPWRDKDTQAASQNYSLVELTRIMRFLLECDIKLKSSFQDKKTVIFILLNKIINHGSNKNINYLEFFNQLAK